MSIHREGYKIILVFFVLLAGLNYLIYTLIGFPAFVNAILAIASFIFFLLILNFFRDPHRLISPSDDIILAPADGKVVVIEETEELEYFKDRRIQISIFMSPTDVHINRTPIGGAVKYIKYHPGKYLVAWHPKSSTANERNTIVIENEQIKVLMRQIAGAVARRIKSYLHEGENVEQGNEMGFIKFGSRVDLFLPVGTKVEVELEQHVTGGMTVIAMLKD